MRMIHRVGILVLVVAAVGVVFAMKQREEPLEVVSPPERVSAMVSQAAVPASLPQLIDLGASKCKPCKMMEPILEDLSEHYSDQFTVRFIDVWKNKEAAKQFGIRAIPTQIFVSADGKELYRHEGFFPKEDILSKWNELSRK